MRARALVLCSLVACDPALDRAADSELRDGPTCGDGIVDADEACDLGFANRADGPCRACRLPACGDGVVDPGEACDDGNDDDGDACTAACTRTLAPDWTRTFDAGIRPESIADVALAPDGDVFVIGHADRGPGTPTRIRLARIAPSGDPRWEIDLPPDDRTAVAAALARRGDEIVVAGTVLGVDDAATEPWLAVVDADGTLRREVALESFGAMARDVAATAGVIALATAVADGRGNVLAIADTDVIAWQHVRAAPPVVDARAVAIADGGDVIAGGGSRNGLDGWIDRLAPDGSVRWAFEDTEGVVEALALDGSHVLAAITERIAAADPSRPTSWTTGVRVLELDAEGVPLWSQSFAPAAGRREATGIAIGDHDIAVVGADPRPLATCSELSCESRPWIAMLQRGGGTARVRLAFETIDRGRARAVAIDHDARVYVGGHVQQLFANPDAWLTALRPQWP